MRTTLVSETLRLRPGVAATLDVEVTNTSAIIDGLTAVVLGLEPAWVQLTQPVVTLFPEATGTLTLRSAKTIGADRSKLTSNSSASIALYMTSPIFPGEMLIEKPEKNIRALARTGMRMSSRPM